jgi:RNA polymerase sigma-70 factor (ECF subfamily)
MEEQFFLEQIRQHNGILIKLSNLYADHPEDRKDLRQEIIYQCWKSMLNFRGDAKFSTWLYRIGLNVSLTFLSKQKQKEKLGDLPVQGFYFEQHELSDRADRLYRAIRQLSDIDKGIIMLHLDGYDNTAISEITGISKNNTGVKLHRIKEQLTVILNKQ